MSISPYALKLGAGVAAAAVAGTITFINGQKHDATVSSGDQTTWNQKVIGTELTSAGAALVGAAMLIGTRGTPIAAAGPALGAGILFGGIAGSIGGFLGSMAVN